jgi:hypothetical protein
MKKTFFLSLIMLFLMTACTEETMQKLQSNTFYPDLSIPFWNKQIQENSELWQQALPYCQANPIKVNCGAVNKAWTEYNMRQRAAANAANGVNQPNPIVVRRLIRNRILRNNAEAL